MQNKDLWDFKESYLCQNHLKISEFVKMLGALLLNRLCFAAPRYNFPLPIKVASNVFYANAKANGGGFVMFNALCILPKPHLGHKLMSLPVSLNPH